MLETFVPVPSLDVPVAQMVDQLVEVLRLFDTMVFEQVIRDYFPRRHPAAGWGLLVDDGHIPRPVGPSGGPFQGGKHILAVVGTLVGDVPVTLQRQIPAVLRVLRASGPVPRKNGGHSSYATVTVAENCGGSAVAGPWSRMLCSTVETHSASARDFWNIFWFSTWMGRLGF